METNLNSSSPTTESEILDEIVQSGEPGFRTDVAESLLELKFSDRATQRMRVLLDRNNRGELTPDEETELERFRRVGLLIDLIQAKVADN